MSWPVWVKARHTLGTLGNTARSCHIMSPHSSG